MNEELFFEIQDSLSMVRDALSKAKLVHEEIEGDFYVEAARHGATIVMMQLPRYKAFHAILGDLLDAIEARLPSDEWLKNQKEKYDNE